MFERFTEPARQVVVLAEDEARLLKHGELGTEHLLLGLLREGEGTAARLLAGLGIELDPLRARVQEIAGPGEGTNTDQVQFTTRAKNALALAFDEALSLGLHYIDTRHILLGLIRENQGVGAEILRDFFGVDAERVQAEIIRMRGPVNLPPRRRFVICGECKSPIEFEIVITHKPSLAFPVTGTVHRTCPDCGNQLSISYGLAA